MKTYSQGSTDLERTIERMREAHHSEEPDGLKGVTIACLFVFDAESSEPVLKHQGYPAAATIRITPARDRALGVADAVIVVDRASWSLLNAASRDALIDHELTHLERVIDEETAQPQFDAVMRPKLAIRRHDHQLGWFDEVANRHGEASMEIRQARSLIQQSGQLYLPFTSATVSQAGGAVGVSTRVKAGIQRAARRQSKTPKGSSRKKAATPEARAH